jgi:hypothetical protein
MAGLLPTCVETFYRIIIIHRAIYCRTGQLRLTEGPHNSLRFRLRAARVYAYIENQGGGGLYLLEGRYLQPISYAERTDE